MFDNLIVLCSSCHTIIDKAEEDYPDTLINDWKRNHENRLAQIFGAISCAKRSEVFDIIEPLLEENHWIFQEQNPELEYRFNPESEHADVWKKSMRSKIIPNNRKVLATLDANKKLMIGDERRMLEKLRQHIFDLEARHLTDDVAGHQSRFPEEINKMMAEN